MLQMQLPQSASQIPQLLFGKPKAPHQWRVFTVSHESSWLGGCLLWGIRRAAGGALALRNSTLALAGAAELVRAAVACAAGIAQNGLCCRATTPLWRLCRQARHDHAGLIVDKGFAALHAEAHTSC